MNKKTYAILSVAIAAALTAGVMSGSYTLESEREIIIISGSLPDFPVSYLAEETTYAIKGVVTQTKPVPVQYDVAGIPNVFTDVVIAVEKDLKGLYTDETITVRIDGGQTDDYDMVSETAPEFEVGEKVFIFVGDKETDSIYGGNYYVAGLQHGKYNLDVEGEAKNKDPLRNISEDELKAIIQTAQSNG